MTDEARESRVDAALVARVARGDERAFDQLVRRHLQAALVVARSRLAIKSDAEDVCQEAFMIALRRIDQCRHPDRFRGWLLTIVKNRAHNVRAWASLREAVPIEETNLTGGDSQPDQDLHRSELRRDLARALKTLTQLQRRVVVLHDLEGWTHKEIGGELGISQGSSRVHLHVARRKLRTLLNNAYKEG